MSHFFSNVVDLKLSDMSHLELGHYAINLADAFSIHSGYQEEHSFPPPITKPAMLKDMGTNFLIVTTAAESREINKIAERDAMRQVLELHVAGVVHWAVLRSKLENNSSLIANLPVQTKKKPVRSTASSGAVHAPQNPKAKHGTESGTAIISAMKVEKARAYYVSYCTGDPTLEESWSNPEPFDSCRRMMLSGFEPGKLYYFRVRCFGKGGMSPWSEIISLRML